MTSKAISESTPSSSSEREKRRAAINAFLSNDAHEQWHDFAAFGGVSVAGLLQAMASELHQVEPEVMDEIIGRARLIDARRRRRRTD